MSIYVILLVTMAISGAFMALMSALGASSFMARYRRREDRTHSIAPRDKQLNSALNSAVSTGLVFALVWLLHDRLFIAAEVEVSALRIALEAVAILAVYDLGYYLLHRFAFHEWKPGRRVHSVHHVIRTPFAKDSLWIHPLETAAGIALLMGSTLLIGPVAPYSFGLGFLVYSLLNIFIHSAFDLPFFGFRTLSRLSRNHDAHHRSMKGGYYASITPLWDHVFGTADPY